MSVGEASAFDRRPAWRRLRAWAWARLRTLVVSSVHTGFMTLGGLQFAQRRWRVDWYEVSTLPIVLPRLAPAFHGYRVVQISDIHMDRWMTPARLTGIVELVNQQRPDLAVITGDFVTSTRPHLIAGLRAALSRLHAPDGVLAVLGNHDYWQQTELLRAMFPEAGLTELSNAVHTVRRGAARLQIAGLDDVRAGHARLDDVLVALPNTTDCAILLVHEPDFADTAALSGRFDLQLSGHSHGGQIVLPLIGPPFLPRMGRKYPAGRYRVGHMQLYTNRGLGVIPRVNCRPEISVFVLQAPGEPSAPDEPPAR